MIRHRAEDAFNFRASLQYHNGLWIDQSAGGRTKVPAVSIVFAAPLLVSELLQSQLLPAQVAECVFVYHHGKLSSSPAIFHCSVSDHICALKRTPCRMCGWT